MKISESLPEGDVEFLDASARSHGIGPISAAVPSGVRLLRAPELSPANEATWREWADGGEEHVWSTFTA